MCRKTGSRNVCRKFNPRYRRRDRECMEKLDHYLLFSERLSSHIAEQATFTSAKLIPTGIQEDIIHAVAGVGRHQPNPRIVEVITANKVGKTAILIGGVLKNIFWKNDVEFFNYPIFEKWPYPKSGRIVGTAKNVQDGGPIQQEILKWWPRGKYEAYYRGKHYKSFYEIHGEDGTFSFDVMSFEQEREEFEGPVKGWTFINELHQADLLSPIYSRFFRRGMLVL